ncbi:MAG: nucleotidyltransferase domain-containing protein [Clostridia bacterium]
MNDILILELKSNLINIDYSKIILFGSRVNNTNSIDSDYDILVILNNSISHKEQRKYQAIIKGDMAIKGYDIDILLRNKEEIEKYSKFSGNIIYEAMKRGVVISA